MEREITYDDVLMFIIKNKDDEKMMADLNRTTFAFTAKYKQRYKGQEVNEKETPASLYRTFINIWEGDGYPPLNRKTSALIRSLINQIYNYEKIRNGHYYQEGKIFDHYFLSGLIAGFFGVYKPGVNVEEGELFEKDLNVSRTSYSAALHYYIISLYPLYEIPELNLNDFPITKDEVVGDITVEEINDILPFK